MKRKLLLIVASLLFSGMMFAQDFHWSGFNIHAYQTNAHITGRAYLDGVLVDDRSTVEVAAFVGDELRGTKFLVAPYPSSTLGYFVWTNYYFNSEGETFTFKAYDHESGIEYDLCSTQLIGQQNEHGDIDNPILMYFTRTEEPTEPTYGPEYPWVPSTTYSGEGMLVTAQIKINGQLVDRDTYEVGAFCGEECRAISTGDLGALVDFTDDDLGYFAMMNIMGNNGDIINFYLYDLENNSIVPGVCNTTLELENGAEVGIDIFGGDIFVLNFVTVQTFTKNIHAYSQDTKDYYYLVATPIGAVSPDDVTNMLENSYDLYYFDQVGDTDGKEWINYKHSTDGGFDLTPGKGYLYANSGNVTLTFTGTPYSGENTLSLEYYESNEDEKMRGWNLLGNPFAETVYIEDNFYVMNDEGTDLTTTQTHKVQPMEGFFVKATEENQSITLSTDLPDKKNQQFVINVIRDRGAAIDRAIVRFGEGNMLPKFMLNQDNTKLYIPQDNKDYAVVYAESDMGEMPVNFKAAENGSYTLCFASEEVSFSYLHLIDNITGADVDLLANPNYSFEARTTDYASRFRLVFVCGNANDDDNFAYYNNGLWVINNEGEAIVQVIDVTGRIMKSEQIEGCYSLNLKAAPGVYMFRLINGDSMKVQKVVVK